MHTLPRRTRSIVATLSVLVLLLAEGAGPVNARPAPAPIDEPMAFPSRHGVIETADADTLDLVDLRDAAARRDPRALESDLLQRATALRVEALRALRRPLVSASATATIQNEVIDVPIDIPGAALDFPSPPRDQISTRLQAEWTIYDGGRVSRSSAAERARLGAGMAGLEVSLYAVREATTESYFGVLLAGARADALELATEDLRARLSILRARASEGSGLSAAADAVEAELIGVEQELERARVQRRTALDMLSRLTGINIESSAVLSVPDFSADIERVRPLIDGARATSDGGTAGGPSPDGLSTAGSTLAHPRLEALARQARSSELAAEARRADLRPSVSLFSQGGVARPSPFNLFSDDFSEYGIAGVRIQWAAFDWGRTRREARAMELQARISEIEADAFTESLLRAGAQQLAEWDRLGGTLDQDRRVIELRQEAVRVAGLQLDEGVILPDVYVDRLTDLSSARIALDRHVIERSMAAAHFLSTLGRLPESRTVIADTAAPLQLSSDR